MWIKEEKYYNKYSIYISAQKYKWHDTKSSHYNIKIKWCSSVGFTPYLQHIQWPFNILGDGCRFEPVGCNMYNCCLIFQVMGIAVNLRAVTCTMTVILMPNVLWIVEWIDIDVYVILDMMGMVKFVFQEVNMTDFNRLSNCLFIYYFMVIETNRGKLNKS